MGGRGASSSLSFEDRVYVPKGAYESYQQKMYKYSGTTRDEEGNLNYGQKMYSGKRYTNDEFMEHLEDGNFHSLYRAIIENKLTNAEVTQIKDNMKFGLWGFGNYKNLKLENYRTGREYTEAIIKDVLKNRKKRK